MSLGVLNNIAAIYAQNNLNQTQSSLQNVLQQLSSGSRINSGADDAAGLALADGLHANEAALTQSSQNATSGVGLLQTADGALSQVTNLLNRAVTLATEAANGTLNGSQIGSANQEYQNILQEIGDIGSTTNFNGNTVFTGAATSVFVSDGTASGATTYSEVIGALSAGSVGTTAGAAAVVTALSTAGAGTPTAIANPTASTAMAGSAPTTPTAGVGASTGFAPAAAGDTLSGTLSVVVGASAAITETFATGTTVANAVAQVNADATFSGAGVVASVGTGAQAGQLVITGPTGVANTLDVSSSTLMDESAPTGTATLSLGASTDTVAGGFSLKVNGGTAITATVAAGTSIGNAVTQINAALTAAGNTTVTAAQGAGAAANTIVFTDTTSTDTLDMSASTLTDTGAAATPTGTATLTLGAATDTLSGSFSLKVNGGTAITSTIAAGTKIADAVTNINAALVAAGNTTVTAAQGTGAAANTIVLTDTTSTDTLDMSASNLSQTVPAGAAGVGVDFTGTASSLTNANAASVLTSVTSAIQDVDFQRGNLGASINELNAASNVASAESVNLTSAEDSVRSTNYGQATSDMAKFQVLSQTGIAALSQANSVQQEILKLLQ
jgi:flagellin